MISGQTLLLLGFALGVPLAALLLWRERRHAAHLRQLRAESERWRQRAALLDRAFDAMPDAVVVVDENSVPQVFNPASERMLGIGVTTDPPSEWSTRYGTFRADALTPYASEELPILRALRGEDVEEADLFLRNEKQAGLWLSASARPLRDEDGTARGAVLVCHDRTESRRAEEEIRRLNADLEERVRQRTASLEESNAALAREVEERSRVAEALRENQELLDEILRRSGAVFYLKDSCGLYIRINRRFEEIFGVRQEDVQGRTDFDLLPAPLAEVLRANDQRVLAQGRPLRFEEVVEQNGALHTYISEKFPLFDGEGKVYSVCGFSTDITERKQMEADVRRSEAALAALIESTSDPVWSIDRDYCIVKMNSAVQQNFAHIFRGTLTPGQAFDPRVPEELIGKWRGLYDRVLAGESLTTEQHHDVDGVTRSYVMSLCPIREAGEITGAVVFSRDITELRQTDELARRNQAELTHVLRVGTMGEISSSLAHEINQPLGAIANYASACSRWLREPARANGDVQQGLELIAAEALRAGEIIRRLRDLGRKREGQLEVVDLNGAVGRACDLMRPEGRLQGISLRVQMAEGLPTVYVDGIQIEQVVLNLLLNGIEAMQASSVRILSVSTSCAGGQVQVAVRDTGSGLDPSIGEEIFDPFFTTKIKGLGMGLAISRRIIEAHGGKLWGSRNDDGGSTFTFSLPAAV